MLVLQSSARKCCDPLHVRFRITSARRALRLRAQPSAASTFWRPGRLGMASTVPIWPFPARPFLALADLSCAQWEAFVSAVGMGDDINAIIRTCPSPRDGESELACQVNGGILGAWVGNLATKLSLAASYCASSINVDAICSAGVNGLVSVMGELAATASLAAATCTGTPPQLTTTQISVLGDQTVRGRRLLIGEGAVGNGVQCMVDVGMVASNIANMGLAINSAVNSGNCNWQSLHSPLNKLKGIPEALCTVDIGGAVAYIGQVVTFINLIVVHCQDRRRRMHGGQMPDLQVSANHSCGFRCYDTCCPSVHAHDSHDSFSACSDLSCFEQSMPAHPVKSATIFLLRLADAAGLAGRERAVRWLHCWNHDLRSGCGAVRCCSARGLPLQRPHQEWRSAGHVFETAWLFLFWIIAKNLSELDVTMLC